MQQTTTTKKKKKIKVQRHQHRHDEKIIVMMTKSLKEKISQVEFLATTNKKLRVKLKNFQVHPSFFNPKFPQETK